MSAHAFMDFCLWCLATLWLTEHVADYLRAPPPKKRNRRLPPPSVLCERTGDWRINLPSIARRQGE